MSKESNRPVLSVEKRARLQALLSKEGLAKEAGGLARRQRTGSLPLSSGQERLWFLDQFEPNLAAYNIPAAAWIQGPLDVQQLRASFEGVVARHEILRTTFAAEGGRPRQLIHDDTRLPFELVDLTSEGGDAAARDAHALALANVEARRPFDLHDGPLTRVFLWRTGSERHLLLVLMHHIVSEGLTLSWMFEEVQELYAAALAGRTHTLEPPAVEYADFALWQRDWLAAGGADEDLAYWKRKLAGDLQPLQLPTDRPRKTGVSYSGAWLTRTLPLELVRDVQAMAKQERATLYMACHAALDVLFQRYTQQDDLLVGGVVGMRPRKETERMFGFFINTVVHRVDVTGNPTYRELLKRVRDESLDVLSHHDVPFERVVEAIQPDRDQNAAPLLQVIYDHESVESIGGLHLQDTEPARILRPEHVHNGCSKADLIFFTEESRDGLITSVEYNTALFDEGTIARLIDHFENLLRSAVTDPAQRIGTMELMSAAEREAVVEGFSGTGASYPVYCIHDQLGRLAAERPDAPALRCDGVTYTRAQLEERANRIAQRLVAKGIGPDVLVGICAQRGFDMVAGALGILKAGGAYLPVDPKSPAERVAFMLADCGAPVLLSETALRDTLPQDFDAGGAGTELIFLDDPASGLDDEPATPPASRVTPANVAYAIFTSGSTGKPKGVPIPHANFARLMNATADWYGFGEDDVWITLHSFGFDFSVWEIWGALVTGGTCVLPSFDVTQSPELRLEACAREGVTVLNQTPSAFVQMIEAEEALAAEHVRGGPSLPELTLRYVIFGGEALELQSLRPWFERHGERQPQLVNMYGITETTVHVTYRPLSVQDLDVGRGSVIGVPIPDLRVYVLDEARNPVPVGVTGELYIGGAGVAPGYLNRPELTAERFIPDHLGASSAGRLYRSGDLGRWLPAGELEYLGRIDNQVQLRGFRIELGEIDACIGEHLAVSQALTLAREDRPGDKRLATYVLLQEGASASVPELKAHAAAHLPEYMVPSAVVMLETFPLTINGKIDRRALPAPEVTGEDLGVSFVAPRTPTETTLCAHWQEVLGAERVGARDNFFELGGHSLLATVLLSRVRGSFEVDLPLRSIFEAPTIESFAAVIDGLVADGSGSGSVALERGARQLPPIPVSARREGPLSFDQESIWFFQGLEPKSPAYNVPVQIALTGVFSEEHLAAAFVELARRHEALRTSFEDRAGEPLQVVHEHVPAPEEFLRVVDLSDRPRSEAAAECERLALEEAASLFALTRAPLFRALVVRTGPEQATLVFNVHHLVVDGWSHGRLLDELIALYGALADGVELPPARSAARMVDYAAWQRDAFPASEAWREELAWWTEELRGAPPLIELPTDRPRPSQQRFEGAGERLMLPRQLSDDLRALARREGATLFHVTLAAYQALLHRVTHQDDLLVGAPMAKRTQSELEFAIGNVINTVALRSRTTEKTTLRDLIAQAKETMLGVDAHQDLPWEAIVQALAPERSPSTTPLVQVGFTLRDKGREQIAGGVHFGIPSELSNGTTKSDLTVVVEEIDGELQVLADYPTSLYEPETVGRFLGWYAAVLGAMVADPSTELDRARYLPEAEYLELVVRRNQTEVPYARDAAIHHLVEEQVLRSPTAIALIEGNEKITYAALNALANRWAHLLRANGVGPEQFVGLCAERSIQSVAGLLGILKAGGAYLPLDPEYPRGRIELMLTDAAPRIVLAQKNLRAALPGGAEGAEPGWSGTVFDLDAPPPELSAQPETDPTHTTNGESLFNILYTSGTTGRPKGVMLIHRAFVNRVDWQRRNIPWKRGEIASQKTTFNFVDSIPELFAPLCDGVPLLMVPDRILKDPAALVPLLAQHKVTRVGSVPALVRALLETFPDLSKRLPKAKYWMLGGDAIPLDLARAFFKALPRAEMWNLYGASEVEGDVLIHCANERLAPSGVPSGKAVQNTRVYLLDDNLEPVGEGVVGQIYAGGDCLGRGYINQPELTASAFVRDPFSDDPEARLYRLGDLGRWMPTGEIEYLGRKDHQISLRGFRVELGEVEGTVLEHPDVGMAIAMAATDSGGNTRLICYVSPSEQAKSAGRVLSELVLTQFLGDRLPHYMVPSLFMVLDEFPLTPNGKIDRRALPDVKDARPTSAAAPEKAAAENEVERMLTELWSEVLGVDKVGVEDDFFELGGHSLLAVKLVNKVNDAFGSQLALGSLVNAPTIRAQSKALEQEVGSEESDCLVKIQAGGDRVPFFCVCSIGGTVLNQRPLARRLGEDQPFYGLQAVDLDALLGHEASLEEFATYYIERIKKVWRSGPYRIGGHSFGAMVAFEMARQLEAAGDEVDLVAIFDSGPPNIPQDFSDRVAGVGVFARGLPTIPLDFYGRWKQDPERFKRELKHRARFVGKSLRVLVKSPLAKYGRYSDGTAIPSAEAAEEFARSNDVVETEATVGPSTGGVTVDDFLDFTEWPERYRDIARRHSRAVRNYRPGRYGGKITLYRSRRQPLLFGRGMRLGWERVAEGGVDVQTVPGNHLSILAEPHVDTLAAKLREALGIR